MSRHISKLSQSCTDFGPTDIIFNHNVSEVPYDLLNFDNWSVFLSIAQLVPLDTISLKGNMAVPIYQDYEYDYDYEYEYEYVINAAESLASYDSDEEWNSKYL